MYIERLTVHHGDASLTIAFERTDPAQDRPAEALQIAYGMAQEWLRWAIEGGAMPATAPASQSDAGPQPAAQPPASVPPRTPTEAEARFYRRYAQTIGGQTWRDVQKYLSTRQARPATVEGWIEVARQIKARSGAVTAPIQQQAAA